MQILDLSTKSLNKLCISLLTTLVGDTIIVCNIQGMVMIGIDENRKQSMVFYRKDQRFIAGFEGFQVFKWESSDCDY